MWVLYVRTHCLLDDVLEFGENLHHDASVTARHIT